MPCHEGGEESGERTDVEKQGSGGGNELIPLQVDFGQYFITATESKLVHCSSFSKLN